MNEITVKKDEQIENLIYEIRGVQVMLDSDLAKLYECANGTKSINLAVKRHIKRFPERFMFQLTAEELNNLRFQFETAIGNNMSRSLPFAFTEQGVAMLATVLRTPVAEEISIKIMDAFVAMRKFISSNLLEQKYILEYIRNLLNDMQLGNVSVNNAKYHHNTAYKDAPSICENGILTMLDMKKLGIKDYSDEFLQRMSDIESHVNGNDSVSFAVVGLTDLYPNEDEYNPFTPTQVDFLVTSDLQTSRSSIHYGNEFLSYKSIGIESLRAIDIRLLQLIDSLSNKENDIETIKRVINKYNYLKKIALTMKSTQLDIPLREMSYQNDFMMDVDKLSTTPKLVLK